MMKSLSLLLMFLLAVAIPGWAQVQSFSGRVVEIDKNNRTLTINREDTARGTGLAQGTENRLQIHVEDDTQFNGVDSLENIRENDQVLIQAESDPVQGVLTATSITAGEAAQLAQRSQPAGAEGTFGSPMTSSPTGGTTAQTSLAGSAQTAPDEEQDAAQQSAGSPSGQSQF